MRAAQHRDTLRRGTGDRGVAAVLTLFLLVVLGAIAALVINTGALYLTRSELQNAADSAALAASRALNGSANGIGKALELAESFTISHEALNTPAALAPGGLEYGAWHSHVEPCAFNSSTCSGFEQAAPSSPRLLINAVKVVAARNAQRTFLGNFLRVNSEDGLEGLKKPGPQYSVSATAVAVSGSASVVERCVIPFPFQQCALNTLADRCTSGGTLRLHLVFKHPEQDLFATPPIVETAFGNFVSSNSGLKHIADYITTIAKGTCAETHSIGDRPSFNKGNAFNKQIIDALTGETGGDCLFGRTFPIAVVRTEDDGPCDGNFPGKEIVGFLGMKLVGYRDGSVRGCPGTSLVLGSGESPPDKSLIVDVLCNETPGAAQPGGPSFGANPPVVRLVQ